MEVDAKQWRRIGIITTTIIILQLWACIFLGGYCLGKINNLAREQQKLQEQLSNILPLLEESSLTGENELSLKRIIHLLNSIEQFTRTTPLVECGNYYGHRKEGSVQQRDK